MLEDIRDHSAVPRAQEIEWMAARPLRAVVRVIALMLVAVGAAQIAIQSQRPDLVPLVAQADRAARE